MIWGVVLLNCHLGSDDSWEYWSQPAEQGEREWMFNLGGLFVPAAAWVWGTTEATKLEWTKNLIRLTPPEEPCGTERSFEEFVNWCNKHRRPRTLIPVELLPGPLPWRFGYLGWPALGPMDQMKLKVTGPAHGAAIIGLTNERETYGTSKHP